LGAGKLGRNLDELACAVNGVIARRVRAQRGKVGMSLAELAAISGVAASTLANLESQQAGCSAVELWKISLALDIPVSDLCTPSRDGGPIERLYSLMRGSSRPGGGDVAVGRSFDGAILESSKRIH
jgi:transcriptional regulator with XRE-family HTH domain